MCEYKVTENSRIRRNASFATYDKQTVHTLIDEAPFCHVSAQVRGKPYIQATVHWREGDRLYVHGAQKNKMVHALARGTPAALAFTHFDGYVLPRSAFNHTVSYRSVTLFSTARVVTDLHEKNRLLHLLIDRISPGRWGTIRQPTQEELKMTGVLEFAIEEVSAKVIMQGQQVRGLFPGGEYEIAADADFNPWTGVHPYQLVKQRPVSSDQWGAL
jgi:uncharacterized protein